MYHERPPYYVGKNNGVVGGIVGERATQALSSAGIPYFFRRIPATRQLKMIERNLRKTCALGWFKNPAREAFAKFSKPIYRDKPMVMLVRRNEPKTADKTSLLQLAESPDLRMGVKLGYSYGAIIDRMIDRLKPHVVIASQDNAGMMRMLLGKRFDYVFVAAEEAPGILERVGKAIISVTLSDAPPGNRRYIICTKRVGDDLMGRLNRAIKEDFEKPGPHNTLGITNM